MQQSPYVQNMPEILAQLRGEVGEESQHQGERQAEPVPDAPHKLYVYRTETGGWITTPTKIEGDEDTPLEDEEPEAPIVESQEPEQQQTPIVESNAITQPLAAPKHPPVFSPAFHSVLVLLFFLLMESIGPLVQDFFTPVATVTLLPQIHSITLRSTAEIGRLLDPITLSQSQTQKATGRGHQDARTATGRLTFYNGSSTPQTIPGGSIYTGQDGRAVETGQPVFVPPANLPLVGQATVISYAVSKGVSGNIAAGDVDLALSNSLVVKNLTVFTNGQDARDFTIVTPSDIASAAETLKAKVTASMTAALHGQLLPGQELTPTACSPTVTADHGVGDEAVTVKVTVSENCTAVAYDTKELQTKVMQLLTAQVAESVGKSYMLYGNISVTITKATPQQQRVVLSFIASGRYVYQLSTKMQQQLKELLAGKPRLTGIHLLTHLSGIKQVSISGVQDNQQLPDEAHIRFLIVFLVS